VTAATVRGNRSIRIDGLRRTVSDLRQSIDFYCGALGFERPRLSAPSMPSATRLQLGAQHIDLVVQADPTWKPALANAPDPRFQHAAIVTGDMETAWHRLEPYSAAMISRDGPQVLPAHTGGVTALKFRDPDGHPLELIQFPAGIGDPCWHLSRAVGPTLGIDHFALVVRAVDRSTDFFATQLDLRVTSRDVNHGIEQDRLDGLDGVEVEVVSLEPRRGRRTPHLELLSYRYPPFRPRSNASTAALEQDGLDEILCLSKSSRSSASASLLRPHVSWVRFLRDPDDHQLSVEIRR
jgi:catechol 2,3-dioxygenase-like lactoylglutathione lyase family enzyme